jgi:ankyrin repeat protein
MKKVLTLCLAALVAAAVSGLAAAPVDVRVVSAAKNRDIAAVRTLLKQRADVNAVDIEGMTALHWAAHWDNLEAVKLLLAAGANAKAANRYGVTPLHEASTVSNVQMIEALLKAGANPNAAYGAGETPLMTAARTGNVASVKTLLAHGADINATEEFRGQTALIWATTENHPEVVKLLIERGANVNGRTTKLEFGNPKTSAGGVLMDRAEGALTPLFFAAREGHVETAQVLLASGADINATEGQYGFTPLMTAIYNGHYDFAGMLLGKGAGVNDGSLYLAIEMRNPGYYKNRPNPPQKDKTLSSLDVIQMLLAFGADPNMAYTKTIPPREAQGNINVIAGATPLYRATKSADLPVIRLLMDVGANPSIMTKDHSTALMVAAGLGVPLVADEDTLQTASKGDPLDAIRLFVRAGADVNAANDLGFTALHYAAQGGRNKIVEFLATNGGNLNLKNRNDKTPLDLALAPGPQGRGPATQSNGAAVEGTTQGSTAALIRRLMAEKK